MSSVHNIEDAYVKLAQQSLSAIEPKTSRRGSLSGAPQRRQVLATTQWKVVLLPARRVVYCGLQQHSPACSLRWVYPLVHFYASEPSAQDGLPVGGSQQQVDCWIVQFQKPEGYRGSNDSSWVQKQPHCQPQQRMGMGILEITKAIADRPESPWAHWQIVLSHHSTWQGTPYHQRWLRHPERGIDRCHPQQSQNCHRRNRSQFDQHVQSPCLDSQAEVATHDAV